MQYHHSVRPTTKTKVTVSVNSILYERFKNAADKDMRKYSNIIERFMNRYLETKS